MNKQRHIVSLSGGKDSTALALYLRKSQPDIPFEYAFCDTGRELPSVYAFLDQLEGLLGPIVRLTDYGRTFDYYLDRWGYFLPGNASRWCTKHLKIRPFERFIGEKVGKRFIRNAVVYIGIRADEDRVGNFGIEGVEYRYPFREDGIDLAGVKAILKESGIALPEYYAWRSTGGCWMCPWQQRQDWLGLKRHHPELFAQAKQEEALAQQSSPLNNTTWAVSRIPLETMEAQQELPMFIHDADQEQTDSRPCLICAK